MRISQLTGSSKELFGSSSFSPRLQELISSKKIIGVFTVFNFRQNNIIVDLFLFIPNTKEVKKVYYQINDGTRVRTLFIDFIILVLKDLDKSVAKDRDHLGILYPSRCLDRSTLERLYLAFDINLIPYLRKEAYELNIIRKDFLDIIKIGDDIEMNVINNEASKSVERYCANTGGLFKGCRVVNKRLCKGLSGQKRFYSTIKSGIELKELELKINFQEIKDWDSSTVKIKTLYKKGAITLASDIETGRLYTIIKAGSSHESVVKSLSVIYKEIKGMGSPGYLNHLELDRFPVIRAI